MTSTLNLLVFIGVWWLVFPAVFALKRQSPQSTAKKIGITTFIAVLIWGAFMLMSGFDLVSLQLK